MVRDARPLDGGAPVTATLPGVGLLPDLTADLDCEALVEGIECGASPVVARISFRCHGECLKVSHAFCRPHLDELQLMMAVAQASALVVLYRCKQCGSLGEWRVVPL